MGNAAHPTERLTVSLVTFQPGTHEKLHWHLIEVFYYVISGRASMTDIEGNEYHLGPGSVIYAGPGIAGSHSWTIKEKLQLIGIRATADAEKTIQFDVVSRHAGIDDAGRTAGQAAGAQPEKIAVLILRECSARPVLGNADCYRRPRARG